MQDFRRQCGWCESIIPGLEPVNCPNCAGPLPLWPMVVVESQDLPRPGPGNAPPDGPRQLPEAWVALRQKQRSWQPVLFAVVGLGCCWTIAAPIWAIWAMLLYQKRGDRVSLLRDGQAVLGTLTDVRAKPAMKGRRQQVFLEFGFEHQGKRHSGIETSYGLNAALLRAGDPIWVVFDPNAPADRSSIWPPGPGPGAVDRA